MSETPIDKPCLELQSMIAFNGAVAAGLKVHPDRQHLIFSVGCTVVIEDINNKKQEFLSGHSNNVTCIAVSKSGKYIASGQVTYSGFKADVIIWDYEQRKLHCRLSLHKVKVEAVAFSPNDKFLASLGGEDDGSVVIWNVSNGEAICGSPAQVMSAGMTHCVAYANNSDNVFVTGGNNTLRVWKLDQPNRKIKPEDVNMGQMKRIVKCMEVTSDDQYVYCGTTSGDILEINMSSKNLSTLSSEKERISLGITSLSLLIKGDLLVGGGDGTVCVYKMKVSKDSKREIKRVNNQIQKVDGPVTSIAQRGSGHQFYASTGHSNIYSFNFSEFTYQLLSTCHDAEIHDVAFPFGVSELFLTSSYQNVRIWDPNNNKELVRIHVPNKTCHALEVDKAGQTIVSGWDDGRIRAFFPVSGKPKFCIEDAHGGGVTALALYSDCRHIVSGGKKGDVRVWCATPTGHSKGNLYMTNLVFTLQEHKASVTSIKVRKDDKECVSSSTDGSCIIWDLEGRCRKQMIRVNTLFNCVCYHPAEHQIITSGTDRKVGYFECIDAGLIRDLEGSLSGSINSMDISDDGVYFVSGGDDKLVKVWKYDEGEVTHMGIGHSAAITQVKISCDKKYILSVSKDGAILRWKFPFSD